MQRSFVASSSSFSAVSECFCRAAAAAGCWPHEQPTTKGQTPDCKHADCFSIFWWCVTDFWTDCFYAAWLFLLLNSSLSTPEFILSGIQPCGIHPLWPQGGTNEQLWAAAVALCSLLNFLLLPPNCVCMRTCVCVFVILQPTTGRRSVSDCLINEFLLRFGLVHATLDEDVDVKCIYSQLAENWDDVLLFVLKTNKKSSCFFRKRSSTMLTGSHYFISDEVAVNNLMPINVLTKHTRVTQTFHVVLLDWWKSSFPWSSSSDCPDDAGLKHQ